MIAPGVDEITDRPGETVEAQSDDMMLDFGPCRLIIRSRQLIIDGQSREIGSRAFDLLKVLALARGDLVSREQIVERVWSGAAVEGTNLRVQVAIVRRALGEYRQLVKTVPGRGYLLTADVQFVLPVPTQERGREPAAAATHSPVTNLPRPPNALIGRSRELQDVSAAIARSRLVTLIGSGGIGKTRIAIEFGRQQSATFPDGVWLIDLAAAKDPASVALATAQTLGVELRSVDGIAQTIASALVDQRSLLIFDNCEHVTGAAADLLGILLQEARDLTLLATSQDSLGLPGEELYRVGPLEVPPSGEGDISAFPAVALFMERVRALDRNAVLGADSAPKISEICRRLDGIPLALEMAAARLPLLGVEALRAALDERLRILKTDMRVSTSRHPTLRSVAEWSHALLDGDERRVFRRLSVMAGSFSLDAAVAVARENGGDRWDTLEIFERLIAKSLVTSAGGDPPRYRLLESLRLFATEQLDGKNETANIARRHANFFVNLFEQTEDLWETTTDNSWVRTFTPELDNVRAALDWALSDPERAEIGVALAGAVCRLWELANLTGEAKSYLERLLPLLPQVPATAMVARLLRHAGRLWMYSDRPRALTMIQRAADLFREMGDERQLGMVLSSKGNVETFVGRYVEAEQSLAEARVLLDRAGVHRPRYGLALSRAILAMRVDGPERARLFYDEALAIARTDGRVEETARVLVNLAEIDFELGDADRAIARAQEAAASFRARNLLSPLGITMLNLGGYLIAQERYGEAWEAIATAMQLLRKDGGLIITLCLKHWATLGVTEGYVHEAARLRGFIDAAEALFGAVQTKVQARESAHLQGLLRDHLSPEVVETLAAIGARWSEAQAVEYALMRIPPPKREP